MLLVKTYLEDDGSFPTVLIYLPIFKCWQQQYHHVIQMKLSFYNPCVRIYDAERYLFFSFLVLTPNLGSGSLDQQMSLFAMDWGPTVHNSLSHMNHIHSNNPNNLASKFYCIHFIDEETETQKSHLTNPKHAQLGRADMRGQFSLASTFFFMSQYDIIKLINIPFSIIKILASL